MRNTHPGPDAAVQTPTPRKLTQPPVAFFTSLKAGKMASRLSNPPSLLHPVIASFRSKHVEMRT